MSDERLMLSEDASELPKTLQVVPAAGRRQRRGHSWSRRKSHVAEPSERAVGRPVGSVTGTALMVKDA